MKMVKKVLFGLALGAAVFSFAGCGDLLSGLGEGENKKVDKEVDEEKEITGTASRKDVSAANDGDSAKRIYTSTTLKHSGALVRATFKNPTEISTSKMGLMFDLKANPNGGNDFYIIGLNPNKNVANFYVSRMQGVTDFQASNFGAVTEDKWEEGKALETEYVALNKENNITDIPAADEDGYISFVIYYKLTTNGDFEWAVLDNMDDKELQKYNTNSKFDKFDMTNYKVLAKGTIEGAYPAASKEQSLLYDYYADGAKLADGTTAKKQNYIGYYTQIAAGVTLEGEFYIPGTTFKEPEDAE